MHRQNMKWHGRGEWFLLCGVVEEITIEELGPQLKPTHLRISSQRLGGTICLRAYNTVLGGQEAPLIWNHNYKSTWRLLGTRGKLYCLNLTAVRT